MKMNKILYYGLILLSVLSCTEIDAPTENTPVEPQCIIYADVPDTKTSFNPLDGKVNWVKGDQIFVGQRGVAIEQQGNLSLFTNTAETAPKATFSGVELPFSTDVVAIYPASAYKLETAEGSVVQIPTLQFAVNGNFPRTDIVSNPQSMVINPSFGFAKQAESTTTVHMGFKNLGGLIEFTIPDYLENINYVMIECLNEGAVLSGNYMLKIDDEGNIASFAAVTDPAFGSAENRTHVTVYPSGDSGVFSPGTYYAVVAPGQYKGLRVTLHTNIDGTFVKTASSLDFTVKKSQIFSLPTLVAAPAVGDYFLADGTWASSSRTEAVDPVDNKTKVEGKEVLGYIYSLEDQVAEDKMTYSSGNFYASLANDLKTTRRYTRFHGYVVSKASQKSIWEQDAQNYTGGNASGLTVESAYTYWSYQYPLTGKAYETSNYWKNFGYVNTKYLSGQNIALFKTIANLPVTPMNASTWYIPSSGDIVDMKNSFNSYITSFTPEKPETSLYKFISRVKKGVVTDTVPDLFYWTSSVSRTGIYSGYWSLCYNITEQKMNTGEHRNNTHHVLYMLVF